MHLKWKANFENFSLTFYFSADSERLIFSRKMSNKSHNISERCKNFKTEEIDLTGM